LLGTDFKAYKYGITFWFSFMCLLTLRLMNESLYTSLLYEFCFI
jgi:hypothetical protein